MRASFHLCWTPIQALSHSLFANVQIRGIRSYGKTWWCLTTHHTQHFYHSHPNRATSNRSPQTNRGHQAWESSSKGLFNTRIASNVDEGDDAVFDKAVSNSLTLSVGILDDTWFITSAREANQIPTCEISQCSSMSHRHKMKVWVILWGGEHHGYLKDRCWQWHSRASFSALCKRNRQQLRKALEGSMQRVCQVLIQKY